MGGHSYWCVVPYQPDAGAALEALRERELAAAALDDAEAAGRHSILDIHAVGDEPVGGVATPLPDEVLLALYGTTRPTRDQVADLAFLGEVERGHAVYVVLYRDDQPHELLFAGCSHD